MKWRTITLIASLLVMLCLFASCDETKRYKVLSYFFDGVPKPGDDGTTAGSQDGTGNTNRTRANSEPQVITYTHKPFEGCDPICHGDRKEGFSGSIEMPVEPPELCYKCHEETDYSSATGIVHGPVAVGECMLCHNPHKSENEHILKRSVPGLCFQCHDQSQIELIDGHQQESSDCLRCHHGHSSQKKKLLR